MVENQKGRKVKVLRPDNRGEYISTEFKAYLADKGIKHQLSISGRPEQNGVAAHELDTYRACPQYQITG